MQSLDLLLQDKPEREQCETKPPTAHGGNKFTQGTLMSGVTLFTGGQFIPVMLLYNDVG